MNANIVSLAREYPSITVNIRADELMEAVRFCISESKRSLEQLVQDEAQEKYLSPAKTAELLDVNASTLWRFGQRNYLNPIRIGGKKRYRKSDIDKILNAGK